MIRKKYNTTQEAMADMEGIIYLVEFRIDNIFTNPYNGQPTSSNPYEIMDGASLCESLAELESNKGRIYRNPTVRDFESKGIGEHVDQCIRGDITYDVYKVGNVYYQIVQGGWGGNVNEEASNVTGRYMQEWED